TMAPSAIATAPLPLRPPPPDEVVEVGLVRTGVVVWGVVGVVAGDCGSPGESGLVLPPWALATGGAKRATSAMHTARAKVGWTSGHMVGFLGQPRRWRRCLGGAARPRGRLRSDALTKAASPLPASRAPRGRAAR